MNPLPQTVIHVTAPVKIPPQPEKKQPKTKQQRRRRSHPRFDWSDTSYRNQSIDGTTVRELSSRDGATPPPSAPTHAPLGPRSRREVAREIESSGPLFF
jgi:hypothetical protein